MRLLLTGILCAALAFAQGVAPVRASTMAAIPGLVEQCAPRVHPQTLTAIVQVESSGWDWTIHDNSSGLSYYDASYEASLARATALIRSGHDNLDLGVAQVNSRNLASLGENVASVLVPCRSIAAGAKILINCERRAIDHFGEAFAARYPSYTVRFAVSCYNTGSLFAGARYVSKVLDAAISLWPTRLTAAAPPPRLQPAARLSLAPHRAGRDMVVQMVSPTYFAAPVSHVKTKRGHR